jgi:hypothetical protein
MSSAANAALLNSLEVHYLIPKCVWNFFELGLHFKLSFAQIMLITGIHIGINY